MFSSVDLIRLLRILVDVKAVLSVLSDYITISVHFPLILVIIITYLHYFEISFFNHGLMRDIRDSVYSKNKWFPICSFVT